MELTQKQSQKLSKNGVNLFAGDKYAGLSEQALHLFILLMTCRLHIMYPIISQPCIVAA